MTSEEFMGDLALVLSAEGSALTPQTELASLQGWDSMGMLGAVALLDSVTGRTTDIALIQACRTCQDVMNLAGNLEGCRYGK
jgi:hypothetical protein